MPSAHVGARRPLLTTPLYPMRNPKVVWLGPPGPVKSLLPGWQREPGNGPAEAHLLPCHHHCQHWSPGRGQPDPGLYRCKMGSNTGPNGVGWRRLCQPKGPDGTQGPILNMAAKNVGVQAGHHLKGFLEGEEGGGEGGGEKRRGEGRALKPVSGTRAGSSMSREELGVLELRSWGLPGGRYPPLGDSMRGEEPQKAGGGQPLMALDARERALECSRSSPTSPSPQGPHQGKLALGWGPAKGWGGGKPTYSPCTP